MLRACSGDMFCCVLDHLFLVLFGYTFRVAFGRAHDPEIIDSVRGVLRNLSFVLRGSQKVIAFGINLGYISLGFWLKYSHSSQYVVRHVL